MLENGEGVDVVVLLPAGAVVDGNPNADGPEAAGLLPNADCPLAPADAAAPKGLGTGAFAPSNLNENPGWPDAFVVVLPNPTAGFGASVVDDGCDEEGAAGVDAKENTGLAVGTDAFAPPPNTFEEPKGEDAGVVLNAGALFEVGVVVVPKPPKVALEASPKAPNDVFWASGGCEGVVVTGTVVVVLLPNENFGVVVSPAWVFAGFPKLAKLP